MRGKSTALYLAQIRAARQARVRKKKNMDTPVVLTISEACAFARIGRTSLYQEIKAGRLRAIKQGRRTKILPADLKSWMESSPRVVPGGTKGVKALQNVSDRSDPDTTQSSSVKP